MTIIQQPSTISLSGNITPFIINSGSLVNFTLKEGVNTLIKSTYEPDATGRIEIDIKDIIESRLHYNIKSDAFYEQTDIVKQFTATIDAETVTFKAIRTGVRDLADTPTNWLTGNFLTWQPQAKAVVYNSPEWLTYYATRACSIKLKAHFPSKAEQNVTLGSCQAGKAFSFNLQYAHIAGLLQITGNEYPTHYDVWAETTAGDRLSFIQRYYFSQVASEQEQWVPFENSLGGLDTLRATGDTDLEADNEHKLAIIDGEVAEYKIDTKRVYTKNTGHLTDYERRWLQDFPAAKNKYIYHRGALRRIAVVETQFNYAVSDLPTSYSFKYRFVNQTSLLNLVRNEDILPPAITIPDITAPSFFLPPRLSELPRVELGEDTLFVALNPHDPTPTVTSFGEMFARVFASVMDKIPGASTGGELINILKENDILPATDDNVFSSFRSLKEIGKAIDKAIAELDLSDTYLSKVNDDTAAGFLSFLKGITVADLSKFFKGLEIGNFQSGMLTGKGGKIYEDGHAELKSLVLRSFLEAPELRKNRVTIVGDKIVVSSGAVIEEAVPTATEGNFDIKLKLEEGDINPFEVSDIIEGVYHHTTGFGTTWIGVNSINGEWMNVSMRPNTATETFFPPVPMMHIAHRGNFVNTERQSSIILSGREGKIVMYDNVNNWDVGRVASHWGKKKGLEFLDNFEYLPIGDNDAVQYLHTLLYQNIIKVDYKGDVVKEYLDKGAFVQGQTYRATSTTVEEVWYQSEKFRVKDNILVDGLFETTQTPSRTADDWTLILSIKDDIGGAVDDLREDFEAFENNTNLLLEDYQNQIDGVVDNWFYDYSPTNNNYPANEWPTEIEKARHIGDTFTNTQQYVSDTVTPDAGKSWRWKKDGTIYMWTPIADSDAVKALQQAAKAQDTADGKRRTFTAQPKTLDAYDVGDLWVNATFGTTYTNDLLRAKTAKVKGVAFNINHWEKASKYTDDTAVKELEIGGVNYIVLKDLDNYATLQEPWQINGDKISFIKKGSTPLWFLKSGVNTQSIKGKYTLSGWVKINGAIPSKNIWGSGKFNEEEGTLLYNYYDSTTGRFVITQEFSGNSIWVIRKTSLLVAGDVMELTKLMFESGDKPTAYNLSLEDTQAKIQQAKQAGTDAQSSTSRLNDKIFDASDDIKDAFKDGIVDNTEVGILNRHLEIIESEFENAKKAYNPLRYSPYLIDGISLQNTYSNFVEVVNKAHVADNRLGIIPLLNKIITKRTVTNTDKANVSLAFNRYKDAYKDYQEAIEEARKAIDVELKRLSDEKVDGLEIGIRNYFHSKSPISLIAGEDGAIEERNGLQAPHGFVVVPTRTPNKGTVRINNVIKSNGEWTLKFRAKANFANQNILIDICDGLRKTVIFNLDWSEYELTFNVDNWSEDTYHFVDFANMTFVRYWIDDIVIVKGNKAPSDWVEALEDIQIGTDNILLKSSFIEKYVTSLRVTTSISENNRVLRVDSGETNGFIFADFDIGEGDVGKKMTFSMSVNADWPIRFNLRVRTNHSSGSIDVSSTDYVTNNPERGLMASITFTPDSQNVRLYIYTYSRINLTLLDGFMLVLGDKGQRWKKSVVETQKEIDAAKAIPYQDGLWIANKPFTRTYASYPIVEHEPTELRYALKTIGTLQSATPPNLDTTNWELLPNFKDLHTNILFAKDFAHLDEFIFSKGKQFSQQGSFAPGFTRDPSKPDYVQEGFNPYYEVDGKTGKVKMMDVVIRGWIEALGGHIGHLQVEESGRIAMLKENGDQRLIFNATNIPTVEDLKSVTSFGGSKQGPLSTVNDFTQEKTLVQSLYVSKDNADVTFTTARIVVQATTALQGQGVIPGATLNILLKKNGVRISSLVSISVAPMWGEIQSDFRDNVAVTIRGVQKGYYDVVAEITIGEGIISASGTVHESSLAWKFEQQGVNWFQFGLNGMMAWFTNHQMHMSEEDGFMIGGKTNMPGALASGTVGSNGLHTNGWGAKFNPSGAPTISGGYRVYLSNMKHKKYSVVITPHNKVLFAVKNKTELSFDVEVVGAFDYAVFGNNY